MHAITAMPLLKMLQVPSQEGKSENSFDFELLFDLSIFSVLLRSLQAIETLKGDLYVYERLSNVIDWIFTSETVTGRNTVH